MASLILLALEPAPMSAVGAGIVSLAMLSIAQVLLSQGRQALLNTPAMQSLCMLLSSGVEILCQGLAGRILMQDRMGRMYLCAWDRHDESLDDYFPRHRGWVLRGQGSMVEMRMLAWWISLQDSSPVLRGAQLCMPHASYLVTGLLVLAGLGALLLGHAQGAWLLSTAILPVGTSALLPLGEEVRVHKNRKGADGARGAA